MAETKAKAKASAPAFEETFPKFKKFGSEDISTMNQVKNSVTRAIMAQIVESYPPLAEAIKEILSSKSKLLVAKTRETQIQMLVVDNEVMFFQHRDGPFFPSLRLMHKYPTIMKRMQVDKGAIPFILGGSNIMCPGFTSKGGALPTPIGAEEPVAIFAEGKEHCLAVGMTKMSTGEIMWLLRRITISWMVSGKHQHWIRE
jgi:malignant T-cell-amplified sequence